MPNATAIAPIRTRAIAESLMLTRSTPASRRSRAASIVRSIRIERGGSISTETTNRPLAELGEELAWAAARSPRRPTASARARRRIGRATGDSAAPTGRGRLAAAASASRAAVASSAARIAAVCSGVVPQQPPTIDGPGGQHPRAPSGRSSRARRA